MSTWPYWEQGNSSCCTGILKGWLLVCLLVNTPFSLFITRVSYSILLRSLTHTITHKHTLTHLHTTHTHTYTYTHTHSLTYTHTDQSFLSIEEGSERNYIRFLALVGRSPLYCYSLTKLANICYRVNHPITWVAFFSTKIDSLSYRLIKHQWEMKGYRLQSQPMATHTPSHSLSPNHPGNTQEHILLRIYI